MEGHFQVTPLVRGYVGAAVLMRRQGQLVAAIKKEDEFLVVPRRLTPAHRALMIDVGLEVHESNAEERPHPLLDVHAAARVVERRREGLERAVARAFLASCDGWLVVDGGITDLDLDSDGHRVIGVIKSHETQFLAGRDQETALLLPCGHRTAVFERSQEGQREAYTWYVRLWPWSEQDLLHGLIRMERLPGATVVEEATPLSRWMLGERAPIAGPDARWDRLLYPMHEVETFLRAHARGWE